MLNFRRRKILKRNPCLLLYIFPYRLVVQQEVRLLEEQQQAVQEKDRLLLANLNHVIMLMLIL